VTKAEGKKNQSTVFSFVVTLTVPYDQPVTVRYATANGAATAGSDYVATSGTLTFAPGETSKTVNVTVKGDNQKESSETFFVDLSGASMNALIDVVRGIGTILDDDRR
jgi:hypothetical protein